jgi:hypothetical protein
MRVNGVRSKKAPMDKRIKKSGGISPLSLTKKNLLKTWALEY